MTIRHELLYPLFSVLQSWPGAARSSAPRPAAPRPAAPALDDVFQLYEIAR